MEQAGLRAWNHIAASLSGKDHCLVFIAGGGNNGGDALVMARQAFMDGWHNCVCILCGTHLSPSCIAQRAICKNLGLVMIDTNSQPSVMVGNSALSTTGTLPEAVSQAILDADMIIDGIAGTGLRGALSGTAAQLVDALNERAEQGIPIVSIDVPSGASDDVPVTAPVVHACATITMGLPKASCYHPVIRAYSGDIITVNPSFPPQLLAQAIPMARIVTFEDCSITAFKPTDYKNTRGHVAVFGGSSGYTGAPRLSSRSAFHARCGLVSLFADPEVYPILASESPSVIVRQLQEIHRSADSRQSVSSISVQDLAPFQALLAGPGWGAGREDILRVLLDSRQPLVLDADAIKAFASLIRQDPLSMKGHGPLVLTPHPGELRIIVQAVLGEAAAQAIGRTDTPSTYVALLQELSRRTDSVILAKGHVNWIVGSDPWQSASPQAVIVDSMTCELGVAGSGDVLAGICVAMLGQEPSPLQAAVQGALIHLQAGKQAVEKQGWFSSEDLIEQIGLVIDRCTVGGTQKLGGEQP